MGWGRQPALPTRGWGFLLGKGSEGRCQGCRRQYQGNAWYGCHAFSFPACSSQGPYKREVQVTREVESRASPEDLLFCH